MGKVSTTMMAILAAVGLSLSAKAVASPLDSYWERLQSLCGQAFAGELITHPEGETGFVDQSLVMHVRACSDEQIRIPFHVGNNYSRTWVLTRHGDRLELKHDHRYPDGSSEADTMYGGMTTNAGRDFEQYFPADEHTRGVIEGAFSNVWVMRVHPGETFTYGLWRLGTPRVFQIDFDLSQPIDIPPPPWGWQD